MRAVIRGVTYNSTKEDIEESLKGIKPEKRLAKYFVEVGGKKYPIKQVITQTLNFAKVAFTSQDAYAILHKLGFEVTGKN